MLERAINPKLALQIECQKEIILNFVNKLEVTFSHLMIGTIAALRRKLKCLSELPKAGSVFKLCQNIKR